jgi:hypothetical protein
MKTEGVRGLEDLKRGNIPAHLRLIPDFVNKTSRSPDGD